MISYITTIMRASDNDIRLISGHLMVFLLLLILSYASNHLIPRIFLRVMVGETAMEVQHTYVLYLKFSIGVTLHS